MAAGTTPPTGRGSTSATTRPSSTRAAGRGACPPSRARRRRAASATPSSRCRPRATAERSSSSEAAPRAIVDSETSSPCRRSTTSDCARAGSTRSKLGGRAGRFCSQRPRATPPPDPRGSCPMRERGHRVVSSVHVDLAGLSPPLGYRSLWQRVIFHVIFVSSRSHSPLWASVTVDTHCDLCIQKRILHHVTMDRNVAGCTLGCVYTPTVYYRADRDHETCTSTYTVSLCSTRTS
mmetsp:Transcript_37845/g.121393  ORF Transcript_37845/g.121393 Transcript_37845/m.121393 type:complete len:235 (+) Transcript_37845:1395-2099(+)